MRGRGTFFIAASAVIVVLSAYSLSVVSAGKGTSWIDTAAQLALWGTVGLVVGVVGARIFMGIGPRERHLRAARPDLPVVATAAGTRELASLAQADPGFQPGPGWTPTMFPVCLTLAASASGIELWAGRSRPTRVWWRPWNVVGPLRVERLDVDPYTLPSWGIVVRTLVYNQWSEVRIPLQGGPLSVLIAGRHRATEVAAQLEAVRETASARP